jgi:type II secretory pathway component GspD/PulD (secretin)
MTYPLQSRLASITRCTAAWAVVSLSVAAFGQSSSAKSSQAASPAAGSQTDPSATSTIPDKNRLRAADDAYLAGARLLEHNRLTDAQTQFEKALDLNPQNHDYLMAVDITREHRVTELVQQAAKARLQGKAQKAETLLGEARLLDPQNRIVTQHLPPGALPVAFHPEIENWMRQAPALAGAITLLPNAGNKSFRLHADVQEVVRQVVSSYGIRPVFDDSVPHQDVRLELESVPYRQAVRIVFQMGGLFSVPLDSRSILIAKDTPENRERFERQLQETISIPGMTAQEMNDLGNVVRNIFDVKQLTIEKSLGALVLRAPEETLNAVNLILSDLIDGNSEVLIELKLYAIDKTRQRNIGAQLPQQAGVYSVATEAGNIVSQNQTLVNQAIAQGLVPAGASNIDIALALLGSGLVQSSLLSSTIGFVGGGLTQAGLTANVFPTFTLALNSSDSRALDDIQIRVGDRQTADFRIGTRYPIITSTYTTGGTANSSALAGININGASASSLLAQLNGNSNGLTIPQIQYEDLGLTLKATPTVQKNGIVNMHLDLKIEALSGSSLDNIPILASRQFVSDITVGDGKPALMVSSVSRSESAAVSGLPGLGELPGFQTATADKVAETDSSELVLIVTPHVVRRRSSVTAGPRIALSLPLQPD